MKYVRMSYVLTKELGVLPGSEYFVNVGEGSEPEIMQYLGMCGHYHCEEGYVISRQYFESIIIACINDGELEIKYEGEEYLAKKGEVVILDLKKPHLYKAKKSLEFSWIQVEGDVAQKIYEKFCEQNRLVVKKDGNEEIFEKVKFILSSFKTEQDMDDYKLSALIYAIMCEFMPRIKSKKQLPLNRVVEVAVEYMKYNIGNSIDVADVAAAVHLSKYYFSRIFRKYTTYSPYEYLLKLRIDTAKLWLATDEKTIKEIAYALGYQSDMGFIMAFTEKVGVSPGRYRKHAKFLL